MAALFLVPIALLLYLALGPLILLVVSGFKPDGLVSSSGFTLGYYTDLYSDPATYKLIFSTFVFAAGSTAVALFFAVILAWLIERTNIAFKNWLRTIIITPMAIPMVLSAMGWVLLASPRIGFFNNVLMGLFGLRQPPLNVYSLPGMIFVQGFTLVPSAFMLLCFAFRNMDPVLEDASMTSGVSPLATLRRIVLPILWPSVLAVSIITFMVCAAAFDIPGIIGLPAKIKVLSLQIYLSVNQPEGVPDFGTISALASIFIVANLILASIYLHQTKMSARFATITGREFRPRILEIGRWRHAAFAFVGVYLLLGVGFPLAALFWQSLMPYSASFSLDKIPLVSLNNYRTILEYPRVGEAIGNTAIVALVSATALVIMSVSISWFVVRSRYRIRRLVDVVCVIPLSIPHIMLGLALIYVYLTFKVGIYGTIWIIVIAYVTSYITYGTRLLNGTMFQIHKELEEAAQMSGAGLARIFRTILIPLLAPSMIGLWIWVLIHSVRELSAALMLQSYRSFLLTTIMFHIWENGDIAQTATIGVLLAVFLLIVMIAGQLLSQRFKLMTGTR